MSASKWPTGVDGFTDPSSSTSMNNSSQSHSAMHTLANDAVVALQQSVGVAGGIAGLGSASKRAPGGTNAPALSFDTSANWAAANPVLGANEVAVETDTGNVKVGNGTAAYAALGSVLSGIYARSYPVFPSGDTTGAKDTAALQAAFAACGGSNPSYVIDVAPGKYYLNQPLVSTVGSNTGAVQAPCLIARTSPLHIGDYATDDSTTEFIATSTFPLGSFMLDYQQTAGTQEGPGGVVIKGIGLKCAGRAAGFRAQGPREFRIQDLSIDSAAQPAGMTDGSDSAFNITHTSTATEAGAYNHFEHITVDNAAGSSFYHASPNADLFINCHSLNPGNANWHVAYPSQAVFVGCDYSKGVYGWWIGDNTQAQIIGTYTYAGNLAVTGPAVYWVGGATSGPHTKFIGGQFTNNPPTGAPVDTGSVVLFAADGTYAQGGLFDGCEFTASTYTTNFAYAASGVTGTASFNGCLFNGSPTSAPFTDVPGAVLSFFGSTGIADNRYIPDLAISAAATLTAGRVHAVTATTAAFTVTLPTPVGISGQRITVRITPASTKLVTVATAAGNIDGATTRIMWAGEAAVLESDGTNWVKIGGKTIPMICAFKASVAASIPNGAVTNIPLDTIDLDNTGLMAVGSSITVQRPGRYQLKPRVGMTGAPAASPRCILNVYKNGASVLQAEVAADSGTNLCHTAIDDQTLAAGDVLTLQFYQNSGVAWSTVSGTAPNDCNLNVTEIPTW